MSGIERPDGIARRHVEGRSHPLLAWAGLLLLGAFVGASLTGFFGQEARLSGSHTVATLTVDAPTRIRNGEFFEMRFTVDAHDAIAAPTLVIDETIWRDLTINTYLPGPLEESVSGGAFEFVFDALAADTQLVFKVDGQINPDHPPTANAGTISLADGDQVLVSLDYAMEVLP